MKELGEKCGVSEATISRYESGNIKNMRRDVVAALAKALNMSPRSLMGWDEEPEYYLNPETAQLAQAAANDPDMRLLLDAKRDLSPEDMQIIIDLARRLMNKK